MLNENLNLSDCIAALATPCAKGGLGVIRVSGEDAVDVCSRIFRPFKKKISLKSLKGYEAAYGVVVDFEGNEIDDVIALVFLKPHSYTGENVVEFSCHGGLVILNKILNLCFESGCRPALNGEFTKRAFLNGKISLTQAEAVVEIINAQSSSSLKASIGLKNGLLFKKTQQICEKLVQINSVFEANLNYPDEIVEQFDENLIRVDIEQSIEKLEELVLGFNSSKILKNGIKLVLVGEPNVGKSTLMNLLVGQQASIVTPISGTTRDVITNQIELEGLQFCLSDTAGFRKSTNEIEKIGIELANKKICESDLILFVVDGSKPFVNELFEKICRKKNVLKILVLNKTDLGTVNFDFKNFNFDAIVKTSYKNLSTIEKLKFEIVKLTKTKLNSLNCNFIVNERHNKLIKKTIDELKKVLEMLKLNENIDLISASLEEAVSFILELNGEKVSDKVIEEIFSNFCVGK